MGEETGEETVEGGLEDSRRLLRGRWDPGLGGEVDEDEPPPPAAAVEPERGGRRDGSPLPPRWVGELVKELREEEVDRLCSSGWENGEAN